MASRLRSLLLLATCLSAAVAVPTEDTSPFRTLVNSDAFPACPSRNAPWPLTKLRDTIIEKIWGVPTRNRKPAVKSDSQAASAPSNFRTRYGGDVVLRFKIETTDEMKALAQATEILYLDVWESTDEWVDIRIAKDVVPSFLGLLPFSLRQSHIPLMHDLAQAVYDTYPGSGNVDGSSHPSFTSSIHKTTTQPDEGRELFFQEYQPLSVMYPWMRLMASIFPTYVGLTTIGYSHEGRDIQALRIGIHAANDEGTSSSRQTILISGGSHAREWISTTTVNYIAYSLITRYGKFPGVTKLLENFDIVFIPTLNPDGYVYTWEHDRLWRKNRQNTTLPFCHGIDLDRSFGFEWDGAATTDNPCSESYAGEGAWSGIEAKALADWALNETTNNNVKFAAFIDLHSYSQQVLYPYSYSCHEVPPSAEDLEELALGLAKGFRLSNGHYYGVSSACEGSTTSAKFRDREISPKMALGGGSALDWFYHEMKTKYAYQIKLRDTGSYGFLLPKTNIVPTGQEAFNAIMNMGKYLLGNKGIEMFEKIIEWDDEYIMPAQRYVTSSKKLMDESNPSEEEIPDEEQAQYAFELRRRRR